MSIVFHQTTQRTGGSDIVRTRRYETGPLTIGRGADCDILLTDLTTSLNHAAIRQTGPGQIRIEALGPQAFQVNGRLTKLAEINTQVPTRVSFGSQIITISAAEDPSDVSVAQIVGQASDYADSQLDEATVFSPGAGIFGKRAMAWVLVTTVLVACLLVPIVAFTLRAHNPANLHNPIQFDRQWSSGPLSKAHAFLDKDCSACHQKAFQSVRDETCLTCHKLGTNKAERNAIVDRSEKLGSPFAPNLIKQHANHDRWLAAMPPSRGLGVVSDTLSRAFNREPDRCASCHREHVSADADKSKQEDKIAPRRAVPALVETTGCADCHANLKARLPDTALVNTASWAKHPEFRPIIATQSQGKLTLIRVPLAENPSDAPGLIFSHQLHMMPMGGVARMAQVLGKQKGYGAALSCKTCHQATGEPQDMRPIEMERDCGTCHALNYTTSKGTLSTLAHGDPTKALAILDGRGELSQAPLSTFSLWLRRLPGTIAKSQLPNQIQPIAVPSPSASGARLAFGPGGLCVDCHLSRQGIGLEPIHVSNRRLTWGAFNHNIKAHSQNSAGQANCARCHKATLSDNANDLMTPSIKVCANCHGKTLAQEPQAAPQNCATCHGFHDTGTLRQTPVPINFAGHRPGQHG